MRNHVMAEGVRMNTSQKMILYRDFVIEESTEGWEWAHKNYGYRGEKHSDVTGVEQTIFECIDAVEDWYNGQ